MFVLVINFLITEPTNCSNPLMPDYFALVRLALFYRSHYSRIFRNQHIGQSILEESQHRANNI